MRTGFAFVAAALATAFWTAAFAFPDGAPWGAANPDAQQNCQSCHFESEPIRDSAALRIDGLPARPEPGTRYELRISFDDPDIVTAGFQLFAQMAAGQAGLFRSADEHVEFIGSAIRSTAPVAADGGVDWRLQWIAPDRIDWPIVFYLAASTANDDGSPFGDTIHFRTYRLAE